MTPDEFQEAFRKMRMQLQTQNDQEWAVLVEAYERGDLSVLASRMQRIMQFADDMVFAGLVMKAGMTKLAADMAEKTGDRFDHLKGQGG